MSKLLLIVSFVATVAIASAQDYWFQECLQAHNYYRAEEGKPALQQSSSALGHAQKRVQQLVSSCKFDHDDNKGSGFGENLYAGSGSFAKQCSRAVKSWFDEKKYYDRNNPVFSVKTGHYTQVVWRSTTELGCARGTYYGKNCRMNGWTVVVCSYNPPGNYKGRFSENV